MDKELIEILCCPDDKGNLTFDKKKNKLICKKCIRNFEIESGIPVMLPKDF